jgi:hypothetical protein
LNRERVADVKQRSGGESKEYAHARRNLHVALKATARAAQEAVPRFVPITLRVTKAS